MEPIDMVLGLADDRGLELLNTRPVPAPGAEPMELIGDGAALVTWLGRVGWLDDGELALVRQTFDPDRVDEVAGEARELRERLRTATRAWTDPQQHVLDPALVDDLNAVTATDHRFGQLRSVGDGRRMEDVRRWAAPGQLLVPPVDAWARMVAHADPALVRQCEGCVIWFHDRTKAHRRRWCSMAMCGNREKARRYRARQD